jgi:hypothetical protein
VCILELLENSCSLTLTCLPWPRRIFHPGSGSSTGGSHRRKLTQIGFVGQQCGLRTCPCLVPHPFMPQVPSVKKGLHTRELPASPEPRWSVVTSYSLSMGWLPLGAPAAHQTKVEHPDPGLNESCTHSSQLYPQ